MYLTGKVENYIMYRIYQRSSWEYELVFKALITRKHGELLTGKESWFILCSKIAEVDKSLGKPSLWVRMHPSPPQLMDGSYSIVSCRMVPLFAK